MNASLTSEPKLQVISDYEITQLYRAVFPAVAKMIAHQGGDLDDAKDVFQDALLIYCQQEPSLPTKQMESQRGYLFGVSRNLWRRKLRESKKHRAATPESAEEMSIHHQVSSRRILSLLETAGKKCLTLLRACYYQRASMDELAEDLGYANGHTLSTQKYKCLVKLKSLIRDKKLTYEDFME